MGIIPTETGKNIQLGHMQIYSQAMIGVQSSSEAGQGD